MPMKTRKRSIILAAAILILLASAGVTAAVVIPSANELLEQTLTSLEGVTDGQATFEVIVETPEETMSATFALWGKLDVGPAGEPASRLEVLASSKAELVGVTAVSDGVQFWLYDPTHNTVTVGQAEEMAALLAEKLSEHEAWPSDGGYDHDPSNMPRTPEEAVAKLLEYVTAERDGQDTVAGTDAYRLRLVPIAEQMPEEFRAIGGYVNLWLRMDDQIPVAVEYAESAAGSFKAEATMMEVNGGVDESLFTFDIPEGAEVIQAADRLTEFESMKESSTPTFEPLMPSDLPEGATAAESQQVGGAIVQRFYLPNGASFFVAQGAALPMEPPTDADGAEAVVVRGYEGTLFVNDDDSRALLSWQEDEQFFLVGGDLSAEQALAVAESLR